MAINPTSKILTILGMVEWGDIGPVTIYRRADRRLVIFPKTWPDKPPSPKQLADRTRFTAASNEWRALSNAERENWATAARRTSAPITGYNLWMFWRLTRNRPQIETIQRQTGVTLL